jgi:phosphodiesterase/alkaline phosphatase D-like protein
MSVPSVSFVHGVASGDPYVDSVILWTRITPSSGLTEPLNVQWEIADKADFAAGSIQGSGIFSTNASRDWSVKVEAAGLSADSTYYYRFRVGDTVSTVGQTKTLPVGSDPVRLAVFSCANFPAADSFAAYGRAAAINAVNPYDALVHLGDYIYEYGPGGYGEAENAAGNRGFSPNREILSLDDYRQRYAQYHTDANLQALRAAAPLIAIWDDHETANDSWAGGAQNHQSATEGDWLARRDAALKAYYEWLPIREPALRQASDGATVSSPLSQGYRSFNFGDVLALHVLETRLTARDEQLKYPDAAAVQARIALILANPADLLAYAAKLGLTPPAAPASIPAFATALAPLVTQELVFATVRQAWGDPSRDLIGADQLAWLQQRMASSTASWQVLGQQVLMQSMSVPAELLLDAGNPALLDKYAAPLQKLATGTSFASLTPAEQALFAEVAKIPYNLDAWDGYGAERETILQSALALGKRLISLAGDTHNAWAGVLDTMVAASRPAGTLAGVEFATPGVTSPGLEKYLPGADAYIRAKYPAVDGLDGLFVGYINGLKYADLNRRGFLDLTITADQAIGSFQLLDATDPFTSAPRWVSETLASSSSFELSPLINWQAGWRELDLVFGIAVDAAGQQTLLDPAAYAAVPRDGVQLPDVIVQGSDLSDRIIVSAGSRVEAGGGADELFNTDSLAGNLLLGGDGTDRFYLRAAADTVIGGNLLASAPDLGLPATIASVDQVADTFLIDGSDPSGELLQILDFNIGVDQIWLDGQTPQGTWTQIRQQLLDHAISINATPSFTPGPITLILVPAQEIVLDLGASISDPDADRLDLVLLEGPPWIRITGTQLRATLPAELSASQLATIRVVLGLSDGKAVAAQQIQLTVVPPVPVVPTPSLALASDSGSSNSDGITNSPTVKLTGLQAGATWQYSINAGSSWSTGSASSFDLPAGSYAAGQILARQIDSAGNASSNGQLGPVNIDTTAPLMPTLALASDSGSSNTDGITNSPTVKLTGLEAGATWQYSINAGNSWSTGSAFSFDLPAGSYAAGQILGRQVDSAGNTSSNGQLGPVNIDTTAPLMPTLALASDSGSSYTDGITNSPSVKLTGLEVGATWQYSINAGSSWSTGSGSSFDLPAGSYAAGQILGRQIDSAGNTSSNGQLGPVSIDTTPPPAPTLILPKGSVTASGDWLIYANAGEAVVVAVEQPEAGASYAYSDDNGNSWKNFAGSSFNLAWVDPNQRWSLKARQRDLAGNQGPDSAAFNFSLFQIAATASQAGTVTYSVKPLSTEAISAIKQASSAGATVQTFSLGYEFTSTPINGQNALLLDPKLLPSSAGSRGGEAVGFWGIDPLTGKLTESLSYDPSNRNGATAYDLDGDGSFDLIQLRAAVPGLADMDPSSGKVLGAITASREAINPGFKSADSQQLQVVDPNRPNSKVAVNLTATLISRAATVNEVGFIVVEAGKPITLDLIRQGGNVLFSGLESSNTPDLSALDLRSKIALRNGQTLRFYETTDSTFADLSRGKTSIAALGSAFRFLDFSLDSITSTAKVLSPSGLSFNLGLASAAPSLPELIAGRQLEATVLDFSSNALAGRTVVADWSLVREANFSPVFSLYKVLNLNGSVRDPLTGNVVNPGDAGYKDAAIRNRVDQLSGLSVGNLQSNGGRVNLKESSLLAPMAVVSTSQSEDTFFGFAAANPDLISHFRRLGDNVFGMEDIRGGGDLDYDDHIFALKPVSLV